MAVIGKKKKKNTLTSKMGSWEWNPTWVNHNTDIP